MPNLLQIHEDDLAELEKTLPQLGEALESALTNRVKTQLRRCKLILSNVRWNYGPPSEVERIPTDPDQDS